jgi:cytoskeleton protein RodZ
MNSERAEQPATPEIPHGVPGKALAAQREAMGWTVEQVAEQLKLQVRQVVALEAGDYAALPGPAVVRGFVRAYAKILKLDAAPLVAMIEMDTPAPVVANATPRRESKPATFSEHSNFPLRGKRSSLPVGWIVTGVVVVAAAAAAWHLGILPSGSKNEPAAPAASTTTLPASGPGASDTLQKSDVPLISVPGQDNGAAPAGEAQPATPPAAPSSTPAAPAGGNVPAAQPAAPAAGNAPAQQPAAGNLPAAAAPAQPAAAQPPVQAATSTAVGANALVFTVREDSWIQVRTADGKNLISRLVKAGGTESVPVDQPVTMIVGNPKGVSASLRGANVELPMLPGKTISRVSLK